MKNFLSARPLLALLLLVSPLLQADEESAYLRALREQARSLALGMHQQWLDLGHYLPAKDGKGYTSLADSRNFFNAANGKYAPQAELEATLAAFFTPTERVEGEQHPQCRFIARYQWLKQQLDFDPRRLPEQPCPRFEEWHQAINPAQVTLIFPAAYMNNPSSMFGHTLLRIDMPEQTERTRLLSYAINFAAQTDETNGIIFAIKGLTGGYPGGFSIMPYYEKVKEYNDLENRDIWEYQLTLDRAEIRRLLEHIWELGQVRFDYYFFDENCSYQLLVALDVARPGLGLAAQFPYWAIPSDTLRAVTEQQGLLKKVVYRPAAATRLQHRLAQLSEEEQRLAHGLATGSLGTDDAALAALPATRQAHVLEAAYDYLQYLFHKEALPRESVSGRSLALLRARSRVDARIPNVSPTQPAIRPDLGHRSSRLAISRGRQWGEDYLRLRLRPAYHDLLDPAGGYTRGAQIDFFDFTVQHDLARPDSLWLEQFTLVDILSVSARDRFFDPLSWKVATGVRRISPLDHNERPLAFYLDGGAGPSFALGEHSLLTLFAEGELAVTDELPQGYNAFAGASLALTWHGDRLNAAATARHHAPLQADNEAREEYRLDLGLGLGRQSSLRLSAALEGEAGELDEQLELGLHWYF